jgi:hypothetical protein
LVFMNQPSIAVGAWAAEIPGSPKKAARVHRH